MAKSSKEKIVDKIVTLLETIADRLDPQKMVAEKEGMISVSRTVLKQKTDKNKKIKIRPFVTDTANVSIKYGLTQGMPNYGSCRADVMISVPCYKEEILEVYDEVRGLVDEKMEKELERFGIEKDEESVEDKVS